MKFSHALLGLATAATLPLAAEAYPIDCAILLCLAGGFPASAECAAAKAEMIRRITPFPIEPPLQLWNCPMRGSAGIPVPGIGVDGLTADTRQYRDGIEIYQISYRQWRGGGDTNVSDGSKIGRYDSNGDFAWHPTSMQEAPSWIFDATGVDENTVRNQIGTIMMWRGVLMRWHDYEGTTSTEWVPY